MILRLAAALIVALLAGATALAQEAPPAEARPSLPLIGELKVRLNGYLGRDELLVENLQVRVQGLEMRTAPDGSFHLPDMGAHGHSVPGTGRVTFMDDEQNWVRFALGRQYLRLPIVWVGEARGDAIVLYPVLCELNADESGGCFAQLQNDREWERRLRDRYGLTPLPAPAAQPVKPAVPAPLAVPPVPAVVVPIAPTTDGVQGLEPIDEQPAAPTIPVVPVTPAPVQQPIATPAVPAPPPGEIRVIEPIR